MYPPELHCFSTLFNTYVWYSRQDRSRYVYNQYAEVVYVHVYTYVDAIERPTILHMCMYNIVYGECEAIFLISKATLSLNVCQSYMGLSINA